jgi:hypothetical protein
MVEGALLFVAFTMRDLSDPLLLPPENGSERWVSLSLDKRSEKWVILSMANGSEKWDSVG